MPKKPTKVTSKLKQLKFPSKPQLDIPFWKGPQESGVTQGFISLFLNCRERCRLKKILGLVAAGGFEVKLEYGQMWHICEEVWAKDHKDDKAWRVALSSYASSLAKKHPTQTEQISQWFNVCRLQFPIYQQYWKKHPHMKGRKPLLEEVEFKVPYTLPSGRVVLMRGKWDSVDLVTAAGKKEVWLQDNKTKSEINDRKLTTQLSSDLQSMYYLIALKYALENNQFPQLKGLQSKQLQGIRYNVIKRPLSGGVGTIRQHKPTKKNPQGESKKDYYTRLEGIIKENADEFFARWEVLVIQSDLERFEQRTLIPILEQLWDWWEYMQQCDYDPWNYKDPSFLPGYYSHNPDALGDSTGYYSAVHWQHPYGIYNVLNEGGATEYDEYLRTGSTLRLERAEKVFPELSEE